MTAKRDLAIHVGKVKMDNKVVVADPCYDAGKEGYYGPLTHTFDCVSGDYNIIVEKDADTHRNCRIIFELDKDYKIESSFDFLVCVDSGQAGIYAAKDYKGGDEAWYWEMCDLTSPHFSKNWCGIKENSFCSATGWGDGAYAARVSYQRSKAVRIEILFMNRDFLV